MSGVIQSVGSSACGHRLCVRTQVMCMSKGHGPCTKVSIHIGGGSRHRDWVCIGTGTGIGHWYSCWWVFVQVLGVRTVLCCGGGAGCEYSSADGYRH